MRHKQRPVKSSRHKSVTFIIDSHTSFGNHNESEHEDLTQHLNSKQQQHYKTTQPILTASSPRAHRSTSSGGSATSSGQQPSARSNKQLTNVQRNETHQRAIVVAGNDEAPSNMRKQFEHNYRHMSDVMSILQRNIQQQLQQERHDQMQQQLQLQQQFHQTFSRQQLYEQELADDYDVDGDYDNVSDSRIFATATSTPNNSSSLLLNRVGGGPSASKIAHQQPGCSGDQRLSRVNNVGNSRKRTKDPMPPVESSNHFQAGSMQNYGEGFFCDEPGCGKSFASLRKLRHHKVVHSDEYPFVCEFKDCSEKFKRKFGIDLHSTTHFNLDPAMYSKTTNSSSLPFFGRRMQYSMCKPCGQKFKTVHEYQYHMLKHGKEPFECPVKGCGQTFGIWKSFQKHRASHYFNYYCKMDPRCDHHTSNLQLLKLHIYCCHFRRKLPEDATLSSGDSGVDKSQLGESVEIVNPVQRLDQNKQSHMARNQSDNADYSVRELANLSESTPQTRRRDSRLRKNPPRSSTFGQQDYASINNGSSFTKSTPSTTQSKRTRSVVKKQRNQQQCRMKPDIDEFSTDADFEMSDSGVFATATPTTSTYGKFSTNFISKDVQQTSTSNGKKRTKVISPRVAVSNTIKQEEAAQDYGEGFYCDEPDCGKSFPSLRKLRHHKVVHSDEFPFVCEFKDCAKKFKRKFGIDLHSTTHFDLDPAMYSKTSNNSSLPFFGRRMQYSMCKPCGQKFKTVHEYQYHMLKHGKEPFECPVKGCGQTFGIWKSFQKHRASHYFNYYCKMDPRCDHHTSNLQLLKLHIYCCHFRRKLPENATLSSKDSTADDSEHGDHTEVMDTDLVCMKEEEEEKAEEESSIPVTENSEEPASQTPRRDLRLRKNPPRSSTLGQQDYAAINNGISFVKSPPSTRQVKRTRVFESSQSSVGQSASPPEKKIKLPTKALPKRTPQRLPMPLIADDSSTEDERHSSEDNRDYDDNQDNCTEEGSSEQDSTGRNRFKCNLCDYHFSVRFQLTKHLSTHLDLTPDMYSKTADKQVVKLSALRRREFQCDKCRIKYEQMSDLDEHMQKKHGQRPYVCNFCQVPSTFSMAKQYLSHLYEHRFIYKCTMEPDCDFTINRKDALKLHIFRMHLNQQLPTYLEDMAHTFYRI